MNKLCLILYSLCTLVVADCSAQDKPMHGTLNEVIINGNQVQKILRSARACVVDYAFVDDNILVASYDAGNRKNSYLFLMDVNSDTLAMTKLPEEPLSLYKSCVGKYYCVCENRFYPIVFDAKTIKLNKPYPIALLKEMRTCEYANDDKFYYRLTNKNHFEVSYGWEKMGDSVFHLIKRYYLLEADRASTEELIKIIELYEHFQFSAAARLSGTRYLLNNTTYASIDLPLYTSSDSLVIFDLRKKFIDFYDLIGQPLTKSTIQFEWKDAQHMEILKDEMTGRFYVHRRNNSTSQTLEELDISTGHVYGAQTPIIKPFAEKIKVHNGKIYYLWQDSHNAATTQLFVQR